MDKKIIKLTDDDAMKYEIADELGLLDKVRESGWKSLTAKESGKIGGLITKRKRENANTANVDNTPMTNDPRM